MLSICPVAQILQVTSHAIRSGFTLILILILESNPNPNPNPNPVANRRNEMMGCGETFGPHANCKFGDTFIGKIGCQYDGKVLLPADKQPVTCQDQTTWCCPCGYDNDGTATRSCGLFRSDPRPWSTHYEQEKLLPATYMRMAVKEWEALGWYSTPQDFMWCNVGGRCHEICKDGTNDCTPGGCNGFEQPPTACGKPGPSPGPPPSPPSPPSPVTCDWETADVSCSTDDDCATWASLHCSHKLSQHYCKPNKACHFAVK